VVLLYNAGRVEQRGLQIPVIGVGYLISHCRQLVTTVIMISSLQLFANRE
jgi:hypothetical protein